MASQHYEMIRDGAPATWTKDMVHVAKEIAAAAADIDLERLRAGAAALSKVPIVGDFTSGGRWRDGLTERCCMSERAVSRVLTELGRADYEMRVQIGVTKNGEPLYAAKGNAVTFAVRYLPPRPQPQSPPSTASFDGQSPPIRRPSSPQATTLLLKTLWTTRKARRIRASFDGQSPPLSVPKPAEFGGPVLMTSRLMARRRSMTREQPLRRLSLASSDGRPITPGASRISSSPERRSAGSR